MFKGRSKQERKRRGKNSSQVHIEDTNKEWIAAINKKTKSKKSVGKLTEFEQYTTDKMLKQSRRKLENVKKRKDQRKKRSEIYEKLKINQISKESLAYFTSTVKLGQISKFSTNPNINHEDFIDNVKKKQIKSKRKRKNNTFVSSSYQIVNVDESSSLDDSCDEIDSNIHQQNIFDTGHDINIDSDEINNIINNGMENNRSTIDKSHCERPAYQALCEVSSPKKISLNMLPVKKPSYVLVNRDPKIQMARLKLPILGEEQLIMEMISSNDVVIISGETGSGKTTQLPQFLYEAGYSNRNNDKKHMQGMIGITEPRRVAAIAMSERVGLELGFRKNECSYKIRHDGTVSSNTQIKFMTDGILIKEIENDFLLESYSAIIIDEAHERSLHTDILLGLLSRIVHVRKKRFFPLKLIIMSATLQIEQFEENKLLFPGKVPPVLKILSRQYPVTIHFSRKTPLDYLNAAYNRVCKIHKKNPLHGSILVFVTSHREVNLLSEWLKSRFSVNSSNYHNHKNIINKENFTKPKKVQVTFDDSSTGSDEDIIDQPVEDSLSEESSDNNDSHNPMIVYPLYANLSTEKQKYVFLTPPENVRHCIIATNVAETSITIPNVKYVVDTGKVKQRLYDSHSSATTFEICWCSKASAEQRAGRAGRIGPGHCYRLYSSVVYQYDMPDFTEPDILRQPLESVILQMKCLGIARVEDFPFPTPPSMESIQNAENLLIAIKALEKKEILDRNGITTNTVMCAIPTMLGREMAKLPISPRYAIMLLKALEFFKQKSCEKNIINIVFYVVVVIASFSVRDLLLPCDSGQENETFNNRLKWISKYGQEYILGDFLFIIKLVGASLYYYQSTKDLENYCHLNKINLKALNEVFSLIEQLKKILKNSYDCVLDDIKQIPPPNSDQIKSIVDIILYGFPDHVAVKLPKINEGGNIKYPYQCNLTSKNVFIHPLSVLSKRMPQWILFVSLHEGSQLYVNNICAVNPESLTKFDSYCHFDISKKQSPTYDFKNDIILACSSASYGPHAWKLPNISQISMKSDSLDFYKIYTIFLLDGTLFKDLKQFSDFLLYNPKNLMSSDQIYNKNICLILDLLMEKNISNKKLLQKQWKKNPKFLFNQYILLLPEVLHSKVESVWPPSI